MRLNTKVNILSTLLTLIILIGSYTAIYFLFKNLAYDTEYAQKINLEFQDSYQVKVVQDGETRNVKGDGMTLDLLAGGAALLVFE